MNGQDYLNQISKQARPTSGVAAQGGWQKIMQSVYFKIGVGTVVALIVIMIIGAALGGGPKETLSDQIAGLQLRLRNTGEVIQQYQNDVKSAKLRSSSASLYSVLATTRSNLQQYNGGESYTGAQEEEARTEKDELTNELFTAKINGNLDRIYAHKMAYEISWITAKEMSIMDATKSEELKGAMGASLESLDNLYDNFSNFSEAK